MDTDPIVCILLSDEYKRDDSHSNHYITIIPRKNKKYGDRLKHDCIQESQCTYYNKYYDELNTKVNECINRSTTPENEWQTMFVYSSDVISNFILMLYVGYNYRDAFDREFSNILKNIEMVHDISRKEITFKNLEFFIGGFCLKNGEYYLPTKLQVKYNENKLQFLLYADTYTTKGQNRIEYNNRLKPIELDYNYYLHFEYKISQYKLTKDNIVTYMIDRLLRMYNDYRYLYDTYVSK